VGLGRGACGACTGRAGRGCASRTAAGGDAHLRAACAPLAAPRSSACRTAAAGRAVGKTARRARAATRRSASLTAVANGKPPSDSPTPPSIGQMVPAALVQPHSCSSEGVPHGHGRTGVTWWAAPSQRCAPRTRASRTAAGCAASTWTLRTSSATSPRRAPRACARRTAEANAACRCD
jgi:hypothetical protein